MTTCEPSGDHSMPSTLGIGPASTRGLLPSAPATMRTWAAATSRSKRSLDPSGDSSGARSVSGPATITRDPPVTGSSAWMSPSTAAKTIDPFRAGPNGSGSRGREPTTAMLGEAAIIATATRPRPGRRGREARVCARGATFRGTTTTAADACPALRTRTSSRWSGTRCAETSCSQSRRGARSVVGLHAGCPSGGLGPGPRIGVERRAHQPEGSIQAGFRGAQRDLEGRCDGRQWEVEVVMEDDHGPISGVEPEEAAFELVAIRDRRRRARGSAEARSLRSTRSTSSDGGAAGAPHRCRRGRAAGGARRRSGPGRAAWAGRARRGRGRSGPRPWPVRCPGGSARRRRRAGRSRRLPARRRRHDRPVAPAPRDLAASSPSACGAAAWPRSPSMASGPRDPFPFRSPTPRPAPEAMIGAPRPTRPRGPARRVKIHEADAKSLLVAQGLPVPAWEVARTPTQARAAAVRFLADPGNATGKVVIKAQVLVGGRGKAGGVKLAVDRGRGRGRRRADPRARDQGAARPARPRRARRRDRQGVLPLGRPRPGDAAAHVHRLGRGRHRDRAGGRRQPRRDRLRARRPAARPARLRGPRARVQDRVRSALEGRRGDRQGSPPDDARLRRRPRRDQPARGHPRARRRRDPGRAARLPRREDHARRLGAPPPPGARGAARPRRRGPDRRRGAPLRPHVHQARRRHRLHGQRRRAWR